jgi:hypothetical protein
MNDVNQWHSIADVMDGDGALFYIIFHSSHMEWGKMRQLFLEPIEGYIKNLFSGKVPVYLKKLGLLGRGKFPEVKEGRKD